MLYVMLFCDHVLMYFKDIKNHCEDFSLVDLHEPKRELFFNGEAHEQNIDLDKSPNYKQVIFQWFNSQPK